MAPRTEIIFKTIQILVISGMFVPLMLTLLPGDAAKLNRLEYRSTCSFTPWSSLSLAGITAVLLGTIHLAKLLITTME